MLRPSDAFPLMPVDTVDDPDARRSVPSDRPAYRSYGIRRVIRVRPPPHFHRDPKSGSPDDTASDPELSPTAPAPGDIRFPRKTDPSSVLLYLETLFMEISPDKMAGALPLSDPDRRSLPQDPHLFPLIFFKSQIQRAFLCFRLIGCFRPHICHMDFRRSVQVHIAEQSKSGKILIFQNAAVLRL